MSTIAGRLAKHVALFLAYGTAGAALVALAGLIWLGTAGKPDLKSWHEAMLREEFTRADAGRVRNLDEYRQLEDRLFAELRREVYDRVGESDRRLLNRYSLASRADPMAMADNANRSYTFTVKTPRAAVLMLHGLSDSPYSLRALARRLNEQGCSVEGLRLPGHGTAPSGLTSATWEDWAAAVRLAVRDLRQRVGPDTPVYITGYSTGAALAVEYALARLGGEDLPPVDGLVLISPAIGVDPLAWLAVWQERLAAVPGLGKLRWLNLLPEYDPYKYNSFAVNAGIQVYRLTQVIEERITRLAAQGPVRGFPRTLVFQSVVDSTVSPLAVVRVFLGRLAQDGHELVAFDLNRIAEVEALLRPGANVPVEGLMTGPARPFGVTLMTNADMQSSAVVARHRAAGQSVVETGPTGFAWPPGVFALSHVALPIAPGDPIYGAERPSGVKKTVYLGRLEVAGELGLLQISPNAMVRLRFNPFFAYLDERVMHFLGLAPAAAPAP